MVKKVLALSQLNLLCIVPLRRALWVVGGHTGCTPLCAKPLLILILLFSYKSILNKKNN